ncbi:MAG TPA: radical SAM protein [Chloroflexota bacterium]|nr:radical SAM protein [Chloroflexota bacterium]
MDTRVDAVPSAAERALLVAAPQQSLYLEVSNYCNSLCATCPLTFFGNGSPQNMGFEEFRLVVDQVPDLTRAVLHGIGEPLLNPHLPQMIGYLKARGTHVVFNSNAILLTPRRQQQLIDAGLDEYRASLDAGTAATYLKVRGVPAYERVLRNLTSFMETKRRLQAERPHVSLWFTTLRDNIEELPGVLDFAIASGIQEIHVQRLVYFGEGLAVAEQSLYQRLQAREQELLADCEALCRRHGLIFSAAGATEPLLSLSGARVAQQQRPWQRCNRPWTHSYVTSRGDVLPCCFVHFVARDQAPFTLGNAYAEPLAEIWSGEKYREFRRRFLSDDPPSCCAGCGAKWSV